MAFQCHECHGTGFLHQMQDCYQCFNYQFPCLKCNDTKIITVSLSKRNTYKTSTPCFTCLSEKGKEEKPKEEKPKEQPKEPPKEKPKDPGIIYPWLFPPRPAPGPC